MSPNMATCGVSTSVYNWRWTTTNLRADIYTFSRNAGAYIGASIAGAVIHPRREWNHNYYGSTAASPQAIVLEGKYFNPQADPLRQALSALN